MLASSQSETTSVTLPHFQAELLVAKQGPLFIQLRKQQTGLFQARGLEKPVIRALWSHLPRLAIPGLTTR